MPGTETLAPGASKPTKYKKNALQAAESLSRAAGGREMAIAEELGEFVAFDPLATAEEDGAGLVPVAFVRAVVGEGPS